MTQILVVEDDPKQAEEFAALLKEAGCDVTLAGNGQEALDLLGRDVPDIVLTDLEMPIMDGLELVRVVRRDYPGLPIILMTAMGSGKVAVEALRHGAASYVRKSNLARELVRTLGGVLAVDQSFPKEMRVLECMTDDQLGFVLDNDPALIPPLLGYLEQVASLLHPCDRTERIRIGIALHETLLNAIQHGNLELSSDLRQEDDRVFQDLGKQRRGQLPYRDRRVRVRAMLSRSEAVYVVEDEGPGFNPGSLPDPADPENLERVGGRGLTLIRTFMDEIEHNEKGNRITLRKRYKTEECPRQ